MTAFRFRLEIRNAFAKIGREREREREKSQIREDIDWEETKREKVKRERN